MAAVIVVDADGDMLELYEAAVRDLGHTPVVEKALSSLPTRVEQIGAEAVVFDLTTGDVDPSALQPIEELRAAPRTAELPIVMCTAIARHIGPLLGRARELDVAVVLGPNVRELQRTLTSVLNH
jgi:CheY-like chemotaxis protein